MNSRKLLLAASVAAAGLGLSLAHADQDTSGSTGSASVDLNFQVTVPGVLRFRVGSTSSVDTVSFAPTASEYADGDTVLGTDTDGSAGQSAVTVELFTNRGEVTITENTDGTSGLTGTGGNPDTIDYDSTILTTASSGDIPAPALSNSTGNSVTVTPASGQFIDSSDVWTYELDTSQIEARPDTYTGFVTYTASTTP